MPQETAITKTITKLSDLRLKFNLYRSNEPLFFTEWLTDLPELTESEKAGLQRLKNRYLSYMEEDEISEGTVNIIIVHPLLDLMGLCDLPLRIRGENFLKVEIISQDRDEVLQGRIDALVVQEQFWVVVIESKEYGFSVARAVPQTLAYMMGNPHPENQTFGMITNGEEYIFIKLNRGEINQYGLSDLFSLSNSRNNGLNEAMQVLKRLTKWN
ncbi:type I restriction endonuclease subunit R [Limnofasciculus baicalensis]|uniref:Type I restriction endonuclease subunit R n=1 Tax=Limnofasciculus baicalensis BBK-W-15 TaxID=2699891 RepID=A0AAE3GR05_9CYAN|nr:type I restriction endonuclease subunit R [Limnofasciculus baicalensis]MCP2726922.1 type I restriction endonuclease subunit R [Limnofasciculus baicalensis BBK-W-15]